MVSKARLRILAWLSKHPDSLEKSWDVSREISLPGIAEGIGVVRSALNVPLTKLEQDDLIFKRMAHVIGGGNRRRQVYHITNNGRSILAEHDMQLSVPEKSSKILGSPPPISTVFGRKEETRACREILLNGSLVVTGMPGIGKSTFILGLCQELTSQRKVRWAVAEQFSDYYSIVTSWYPEQPVPEDVDAICHMIQHSNDLLVIDDVNLISQRHIESVHNLLHQLTKSGDIRVILISRESSGIFTNFENFKLDALDLKSCCEMLGEEMAMAEREKVVNSLGHHPLALKLYQPGYNIPESSTDVIKYVENVVLNALSDEQKRMVSRLSLEPIMMAAENSIAASDIELLDEQNLVRWKDNLFELQHLIRNVTRKNIALDERLDAHRLLAKHWKSQQSKGAVENYLYHLSRYDTAGFITQLSIELESIDDLDSAALATIVAESIEHHRGQTDLLYFESKIAAFRFEPSIIRKNLAALKGNELLEMELHLALIEGRGDDYEMKLSELLAVTSPLQRARLLITSASRILEDRLPTSPIEPDLRTKVEHYLKQIDLKQIDQGRQSVIVAISIIKHSIAMAELDFAKGEDIIESMIGVGSIDDSIVVNLRTKKAISNYLSGVKNVSELIDLVDANCQQIDNLLMSESLKLRLVEILMECDFNLAKIRFDQLTRPEVFARSNTSIRYSARWWLLHSKVHPVTSKSSLRESLIKFREAGCGKASAELESKFHTQV